MSIDNPVNITPKLSEQTVELMAVLSALGVNLSGSLDAQTTDLVSKLNENKAAINAALTGLQSQKGGFRKINVLNVMDASTNINKVSFQPSVGNSEVMLYREGAGFISYMYAYVRQEIEIYVDGVLVLTKDFQDGGGGSPIVGGASFIAEIPYSLSIEVKVRNALSSYQNTAELQHVMTE